MKIAHPDIEPVKSSKGKQLPMDKDPRFLAALRQQIISDHNKKILAKQKQA